MIELPEAINFARQMTRELTGRKIVEAVRGNSPHKFAFYNHEPEEFSALLNGKTLGTSEAVGGVILTRAEPGLTLALGCGGERILLHPNPVTLPKKHQFLLHFEDGTYLTATIQMWGLIQVLNQSELDGPPWFINPHHSPVSDAFTLDYFKGLWGELTPEDPRSVKYFLISKPGIPGLGNGYLQDILFRARLNPRHVARKLYDDEKEALYEALTGTLKQATSQGGRDSEMDLYGCPGHYPRILHSGMVGKPCPECDTPIVKETYLGGAIYYCPKCQV